MVSEDLQLSDGTLGGTVFAMHNGMLSAEWLAAYLVDTDNNLFMDDVRAKTLNDKERRLRIFSMDHTFEKPSWLQFGVKKNVYLYLSQKASAAEEGWMKIATYTINLLIQYINKKLHVSLYRQYKLEPVEYTVGVVNLSNPSLGLFALHSDDRPGIVDPTLPSFTRFSLMVPTLAIQNHCAPTCHISWVLKGDVQKTKLATFTHDFVISHWQLMGVNESFEHQVGLHFRDHRLFKNLFHHY
jgi:hypothetical protein